MPPRKYSPILRWFGLWMDRFYVPVYRDMTIYFAILLTSGFFSIYIPRLEKVMPLARVGLAFLFGFTAMWLGFCNGFWQRISFPAMASACAVIPGILFWITNGRDLSHGFGGFLYEFSLLLFQWPFLMTQKMFSRVFFHIPVSAAAFFPVLNVWIFFVAGWIVRVKFFQKARR